MSRLRFATANDLFETFPELLKTISVPPTGKGPIDFIKGLLTQDKLDDAMTCCAYLLPRREAVWWACATVRRLPSPKVDPKAPCLLAAEAWVERPETDMRLAALDAGNKGDPDDPTTYLALAAGRSGGLLFAHPESPVSMPPSLTPQAARTAIMLAAHYTDAAERPARLKACIEDGAKLAMEGF